MSDTDIDTQALAGELTLVLKNGPEPQRLSLLNAIEELCGIQERLRLEEWIHAGLPGA